jgi:CubicO group peptidase (beta-lactamase class C family)
MATAKSPGTMMSYGGEGYRLLGELIRRISGQSYTEFITERIFVPLGMADCHVGLTPTIEPRTVCNMDESFMPDMPVGDALREMAAVPDAGGSIFGPVGDYAAFAQMLLNGGDYGNERLLSRAAVEQATRNQVPGIGVDFGGWHDEACWGYGFSITGTERWRWYDGALVPAGSFGHGGLGGSAYWVDRDNDVVALYFSHCEDIDPEREEHHWDFDLFQNLVTAAVVD